MKKKNKIRLKKLSIQVVALLVINFIVLLSFLQLATVQTYLGRQLAKDVSLKTGFKIKIGKLDIVWLDRIKLESIEIIDLASNKMITADGLLINYQISSVIGNNSIILNKVVLENGHVNLSRNDSTGLNFINFISSIKKAYIKQTGKKPNPFIISKIEITNSNFSYNYLGKDSIQNRFDYNHFGFDSLNSIAHNLVLVADTFQLSIDKLSSRETSTQLPIKELSVNYHMSKSQMKFNNLKFNIGNSSISDSIIFSYTKTADLIHFTKNVLINARFKQLKLATQDLKYFAPYFNTIYDTILFSGTIKGHINNFITNNFELNFGTNSHLKGNAYFEGLPDIYNTFINVKIKESNVIKNDIAIYVPGKSFRKYVPIVSAKLTGSFTGYPKDFVVKAALNTNIGFVKTDLNLKLDTDPKKSNYSGSIKLIDFDLSKVITSNTSVGKTSLVGKIKGTGFTIESADFMLESTIKNVNFYNYNYQNITTNAHFAQGLFDGALTINDPNLKLETAGIIDLRKNRNKIELKGELIKVQLNKLHIRKDSSDVSAKFNIDITGITLDSIIGKVEITDLKAHNKESKYLVKQLELNSEVKDKNRTLTLYSDRIKLKIEGEFNFTTAYKDFKSIWLENKVNFLNQKNNIKAFYQGTVVPTTSSNLTFDIQLLDINPLINLFNPLVHLSANTSLIGSLNTTNRKEFMFKFKNDTIIYNHNTLINNKLNILTKSNYYSRGLSVDFSFKSNKQILRSKSTLDSLALSAIWKNDSLNFNAHVQQEGRKNINDIAGLMLFKKDTTLLSILKSNIQVFNEQWNFNKNNQITFTKDRVKLSNFSITSNKQELKASGSISKTTNDPITIIASNIKMSNLNPLINNKLEGILNGSVEISNIFNTPLIESEIRIDTFKVDGYHFGNIEGSSNWNPNKELFDINFFVKRNQNKLVSISGIYLPLANENALNLDANFINTDLSLITPFTKDLFSNIKGSLSGNIQITGAPFAPILNGQGKINEAIITIDYLNSTINAHGAWSLDSTSISISPIKISDNNIGTGNLQATFYHTNYKNFRMDLQADFNNLLALNTSSKDNNYFYGAAIGSGNLSITGPFSNLIISTRAKTEKGTKFYIPLSNSNNSAKQEDFITFTNFTQEVSEAIKPIKEKLKLKNITVNLDIEITPEAYAEIIFDLTAGDIIRGRGKGNLSLGIDSKGEFTMIGDYEFTEGAYNFTMYNIINKEFEINPKSKITWSGDPYLGKMDIDAVYKVNTSLVDISTDTTFRNLPEVKRIYPSKVLLDLDGLLLSPDITFDIIIEDYPQSNVNIDTEVRAFLNKIHNDEQEMNRQVFSLLVFRKFSPPNSFSTGGTVGSSVSEFISNQLSYWISQVDENLTVDFDLGELDQNALETFQLRVSYAFMDGKLIITRDGGFTNQNQETTLSSITGDWTIEYLLSKDGKFRIKIFNNTNYDQLSTTTGTSDELVSGGFSLLYTASFNSIKELFNRNKNKQSSEKNKSSVPNEALKPEEDENTP